VTGMRDVAKGPCQPKTCSPRCQPTHCRGAGLRPDLASSWPRLQPPPTRGSNTIRPTVLLRRLDSTDRPNRHHRWDVATSDLPLYKAPSMDQRETSKHDKHAIHLQARAGALCYRHKLTRLIYGPKARWA